MGNTYTCKLGSQKYCLYYYVMNIHVVCLQKEHNHTPL